MGILNELNLMGMYPANNQIISTVSEMTGQRSSGDYLLHSEIILRQHPMVVLRKSPIKIRMFLGPSSGPSGAGVPLFGKHECQLASSLFRNGK
jgi:hypothetical protein